MKSPTDRAFDGALNFGTFFERHLFFWGNRITLRITDF
jgi:hypothetical protein